MAQPSVVVSPVVQEVVVVLSHHSRPLRLVFRQNESPVRAGGWRQRPEFAGTTLNPVRATGDQRAEGAAEMSERALYV
jgi:hypothetical protein